MSARRLQQLVAVLFACVASRTATAQIYPLATNEPNGSPTVSRLSDDGRLKRFPPFDGRAEATLPGSVRLIDYTTAGEAAAPAENLDCGKAVSDCSQPFWAHRTGVFGEYLLLRPRDAEVAFAVPFNGAIFPPPNNPIQVGPVALVDPDYSSGFRVGGTWAWDQCTSLVATYTSFDSHTSQVANVDAPLVLRSLVAHPGTLNAGADYLSAAADLNVDFQTMDLDYRAIWWLGECSVVNWSMGVRYARLTQDFRSQFSQTGTRDEITTGVAFDGGGIRLGLDGERHHASRGFLLYGKTAMSLVAGEFRAAYFQGSDQDPEIVNTAWKAGRLVPILDLELGAGWQSCNGRLRFTAGYVASMWFNTLTTDSWIRSVQQSTFVGQADAVSQDTLTFDGFVAHAEYRF